MKNNGISKCIRFLALLAALCLCFTCLVSCKDEEKTEVKDPILEAEDNAIPLSYYELLLSRIKGNLARNKFEVNSPDFWAEQIEGGDVSREDYFNDYALDVCQSYLAAEMMFDEEKLKLSDEAVASIEEEIAFFIEYDGFGETEKFNALMAKYGFDSESLKDAYILEAKYETLLYYLYGGGSLIGDTVKEQYYQENYYRFKQILVSNFYYEYERDSQGNIIYFNTENGQPLYDSENGIFIYDENGNRVRDKYGNTVYYDSEGIILYDKANGLPSVVLDENGEGIMHYYSEEEMAERKTAAEEIVNTVNKGNYSAFEAKMPDWTIVEGSEESYPDGYYLSELESGGYEDYLVDILDALESMEPGEMAVVESEYGYHVIMKYDLDSGKYSDSAYSEWFESFTDSLINKLFADRCEKYFDKMTVNEENLAKARSITKIGTNYDY